MSQDYWLRLLSGPLELSAERLEDLEFRVASHTIPALDLYRNLGRLIDRFKEAPEILRGVLETATGGAKIPPYIFYLAAKAYPDLREWIHRGMMKAAAAGPKLPGKTVVILDSSEPMTHKIPCGDEFSPISYLEAAASLAVQLQGDDVRLFSCSNQLIEVEPKPGLGGADAFMIAQAPKKNYIPAALDLINRDVQYFRIIILTRDRNLGNLPVIPGRWIYCIDKFEHGLADLILKLESETKKNEQLLQEAYQNPNQSRAVH